MALHSLVFWLTVPFVVPQAMWVRRSAPRFDGASGEPRGQAVKNGSPPQANSQSLKMFALGDSIIAGVGAATWEKALVGQSAVQLAEFLDKDIEWQAAGKIGADTKDIIQTLVPSIPDQAYDLFIISVGVNDITGLTRLDTWQANLEHLFETLHQHSPGTTILVAGIPPLGDFPLLPQPLRGLFGWRARKFDEIARQAASQYSYVIYIPNDFEARPEQFCEDGYHPSEDSYEELAELMVTFAKQDPRLEQRLK